MITTQDYMDDLRYLGELAEKFGMDEELEEIINAFEKARKELKRTPW